MKLKAAITKGAPKGVAEVLGSTEFVGIFLGEIVGGILGVEDPNGRPAEFYVQEPDITVPVGHGAFGVELRLTGVSRGTRTPAMFHRALHHLHKLAYGLIKGCLAEGESIQLFCVIMLDSEIETSPGSGSYSSVLEQGAEWITG